MSDYSIDILDEITCETLQETLQCLKNIPIGSDININIASYGGQILDTIAMIDALKAYHTKANVLGFACSAAAILALSCDEVSMSEHASLMIHSAWADDCDSDDPGIRRCNDVQLSIIKKRCPQYTAEMLITDKWLSAEECLRLGLTDNINLGESIDYAATCRKYAAKLENLLTHRRSIMAEEIKVDEVLEEVKEDEEKVEENAPEAEGENPEEEKHDLIEVIEKLTEKVNELENRLKALEEPAVEEDSKVEAECEDDTDSQRINNLYKSICKPSAQITVTCANTKQTIQKVRKDFAKYTRI